jgi:antitoxin MazE
MRVAKWGNSLAIRLPIEAVKALDLKDGDDITLHVAGKGDFTITKTPDREALIRRLRAFRGTLPEDFTFDRDDANVRLAIDLHPGRPAIALQFTE